MFFSWHGDNLLIVFLFDNTLKKLLLGNNKTSCEEDVLIG